MEGGNMNFFRYVNDGLDTNMSLLNLLGDSGAGVEISSVDELSNALNYSTPLIKTKRSREPPI